MQEYPGTTDEHLVEEAKRAPRGDIRAFEQLVRRHRDDVLTNCRFLTRSEDHAEDLAQDVWVKAYFGLHSFEGRAQFKTWLQRIKVNHCLNFIEKREGKRFLALAETDTDTVPELLTHSTAEQDAVAEVERQRVREALDRVPVSLRVPLVLRDMDGLSYQEIADALSLGLSAVKMRIKRGREEFRRVFAAVGSA